MFGFLKRRPKPGAKTRAPRSQDPPPCNREIYKQGELVAVLEASGPTYAVEAWVRAIAETAEARLDWYIEGGYPQVMHLGTDVTYRRTMQVIERLKEGALYNVRVRVTYPRGHISHFRRDRRTN